MHLTLNVECRTCWRGDMTYCGDRLMVRCPLLRTEPCAGWKEVSDVCDNWAPVSGLVLSARASVLRGKKERVHA